MFVWRGAWILVDILLFPEDEVLSAWGSLVRKSYSLVFNFFSEDIHAGINLITDVLWTHKEGGGVIC